MPAHEARRVPRAAVASPHYLASAAGFEVLATGGNALDAAIATSLTLGVVAPYMCGFGGDVFAIVWDGDTHGFLGSGRSPAALTHESVMGEHAVMPLLGPHSVTVPGAIDGWFQLLDRWGTRSFGELAHSALRYAREGFEVSRPAADVIAGSAFLYSTSPEFLAVYGDVRPGSVLRQPALANLIERIADEGPRAYYEGPVANAITATLVGQGGVMTALDLATHAGEWVTPLRTRYRAVEIAELPPPTQGVTALEALRILDGFELPAPGPDRTHLLVEITKLALADRDAHVSDPAAMSMPAIALLSDEWIGERRGRIDLTRAQPPGTSDAQRGGTAYLCAADSNGLLVSLIQSNFLGFGSGIHVPEWGINLNNRGSSFTLDAASANVLAPAKRPMHTLIPAMAFRDGAPWLVFGSMGGDAQAQVHVQLLTQIVDDGLDPQIAIDAPRWRVEPANGQLMVEGRVPPETIEALRALGHDVQVTRRFDSGMGHAHAILRTPGGYAVATDPRAEGAALGH